MRINFFDILAWIAPAIILSVLAILIIPLIIHGWPELSWSYFTEEPRRSGRLGGISTILVANALILLVCMATALPLGLGTAVFLDEVGRQNQGWARLIRSSLDVLGGVPSIVFGLFGNAFFCKALGLGFSIASGGLTLACMVLPLVIRTTEEGLRSVPEDYRMGAASLGFRRTSTLTHLLLPVAFPSLAIGFVLGVGRALAETAALVFTSGYVDRMPSSLLDSGRSISVHIYDLAMNVAGGDRKAYAASLTLLFLLFAINVSATLIGERWLRDRIQT